MTDDKTRAECEEWVQKSIKKEHDPIDINDVYAAWQAAKELYAPKWISVEDRLPEPEVPVLAIVHGYDGILTLERRWECCNDMVESYFPDFLYWDWIDNDGQDFGDKVAYWMPLPQLIATKEPQ